MNSHIKPIKIRRGLNIPLEGKPTLSVEQKDDPVYVGINPAAFRGLELKLKVKEGDAVLVGSPVFYDKNDERINIPSTVSGEIIAVIRGEKRAIQEVRIRNDKKYESVSIDKNPGLLRDREQIKEVLLKSGLWSFFRQRPYDIIPSPDAVFRDVYISTFDSAPLAPDFGFFLKNHTQVLQAGINALALLTEGKVHLGIDLCGTHFEVFESLTNIEKHYFCGPHPAGNVGVQIHHTRPINKGEIVLTLNIQDLAMIGKFLEEGIIDTSRVIAVTGSEVKNPHYLRTIIGSGVENFVQLKDEKRPVRIISGNILTGKAIPKDGALCYCHHQLTIIPEGNYFEFLGWASPGLKKFSASRTFLSKLISSRHVRIDTNIHGGERAYVVSGEYEKVFPFDIYPVYLIKAILTEDIDKMEALGIYEVAPEDFALCDVVCTSKYETQEIVRKGLEMLRKEMS